MFSEIPQVLNLQDIKAIEDVPITQRIPFDNTYELLRYSANKFEDRTALQFTMDGFDISDSFDLSYREFFERTTQAANLFQSLGLGPRDTISYILPNIPQTHYCIWGGEAAGIVNAVNPMLEADTIAHILNEAECKILVTSSGDGNWPKILQILNQVPTLQNILLINLSQFGQERNSSATDALNASSSGKINFLDFDKELRKQPSSHLNFVRLIERNDIAAYFHTGGTTGKPKIAMHSHFNQVSNGWMISALTIDNQQKHPEVILSGLPLFHVNAIIVTGIGAFIRGATVVMIGIQGYRTDNLLSNFWKIVEHYKATAFSCVPTILNALLNVPLTGADIGTLRYALCGAAPLSQHLFDKFENYTGINILEGYGLTESTCLASLNPKSGKKKVGSIGLRIPYEKIKTAKLSEEGKFIATCKTNEVGTLFLKGPHIFPGYKQKEKNHNLFDSSGWLNTGDLARIDKNNYIWLTGRAKDLIIRGGHNIDPANIEEVLLSHPAVEMACAIGQPDGYAGELPCAYVTVNNTLDEQTLLTFAKNNISERATVPVHIEIVSALPITTVGKIYKPELKRMAISRVFKNTLDQAGISADLSVKQDAENTLFVKIQTPEKETTVNQILGNFTVPFQVCNPFN